MYVTRQNILDRVKEHYAVAKELVEENRIVGLFLQGSQNYNLDTPFSDIDTICLVLPSFDMICANAKATSFTHVLENEEHIVFKDIRVFMTELKKQGPNMIEVLFTEYCIINPKYKKYWTKFVSHREDIARYDTQKAVAAMRGMMYNEYHTFDTDKTDGLVGGTKELRHIYRLYYLINDYLYNTTKPYADMMKGNERRRGLLLSFQINPCIDKERAAKRAKSVLAATETVIKVFEQNHEYVSQAKLLDPIFNKCIQSIFKKYLKIKRR